METSSDVASALRIAGILSKQLKPALAAIKTAKLLTMECACGSMAESVAKPCNQPVCPTCVADACPNCRGPSSKPSAYCRRHRWPRCPHKYCHEEHRVEELEAEPSNGAALFKTVSESIDHIEELLDHLIVLTKDM
ncbi:hypothetical protein FB107DRAFT_280412 [Schizophyllum commune]